LLGCGLGLVATPALADNNRTHVEQSGSGNTLSLTQSGDGNAVLFVGQGASDRPGQHRANVLTTNQTDGDWVGAALQANQSVHGSGANRNVMRINQRSSGDGIAEATQFGVDNVLEITQEGGEGDQVSLAAQAGRGNRLDVMEDGAGNAVGIVQFGNGNRAAVEIGCAGNPGDGNVVAVAQYGGFNTAQLTIDGSFNGGMGVFTPGRPAAAIGLLPGTVFQDGDFNMVRLTIGGRSGTSDRNLFAFEQDGSGNTIAGRQDGNGNEAAIRQVSSGNGAFFFQVGGMNMIAVRQI
jgi:hypothetical protein